MAMRGERGRLIRRSRVLRAPEGSVTSRRGTGMLLDVSCCFSMNCQRPRVERSGSKAAILPGA